MRESASKLRLITIVLGSTSVRILLGLRLTVRLLIIQNLNILIIIIIISFLALHLETSYGYARHSAVLSLVATGDRAWRAINIVVRGALTRCQVPSGAQCRRLVMHQALLIRNVHRIHLHVWIVVHSAQILNVHVISGPNKELLLLLLCAVWIARIAHTIVLLLLLQLHVTVFVFAVR